MGDPRLTRRVGLAYLSGIGLFLAGAWLFEPGARLAELGTPHAVDMQSSRRYAGIFYMLGGNGLLPVLLNLVLPKRLGREVSLPELNVLAGLIYGLAALAWIGSILVTPGLAGTAFMLLAVHSILLAPVAIATVFRRGQGWMLDQPLAWAVAATALVGAMVAGALLVGLAGAQGFESREMLLGFRGRLLLAPSAAAVTEVLLRGRSQPDWARGVTLAGVLALTSMFAPNPYVRAGAGGCLLVGWLVGERGEAKAGPSRLEAVLTQGFAALLLGTFVAGVIVGESIEQPDRWMPLGAVEVGLAVYGAGAVVLVAHGGRTLPRGPALTAATLLLTGLFVALVQAVLIVEGSMTPAASLVSSMAVGAGVLLGGAAWWWAGRPRR